MERSPNFSDQDYQTNVDFLQYPALLYRTKLRQLELR